MDARSFANYLKTVLINKSKEYEGSLLSVSFSDISEAKRVSGIHSALISVCNCMDQVVSDFYDKGGNTLPPMESL